MSALVLPGRRELMTATSLLPVLDKLDLAADTAEDVEGVQAVLEGYVMVEAVASERRLREQANRAEGGVTRQRTKLGRMQEDARKDNVPTSGRGGGDRIVPDRGQSYSKAERNERSINNRLAEIGDERVAEVVIDLVDAGERPTPAKVIKASRGHGAIVGRNAAAGGGDVEWYTPPELVELARQAMGGIDTDPASSEMAQGWVKARVFYTQEDDGLAQPWHGRVWLNPPYKPELIKAFAAKLAAELDACATQACWLSPTNATDTAWCQALMARASAACLLKGRVKFISSGGDAQSSAWASMVLYLGDDPSRFLEVFSTQGACWRAEVSHEAQ